LESVRLGSKDCGIRWAGSLPKQQPEPLQRSLSQELLQVVFQETEPMLVLQPTPLQEPVVDLGFLNGGGASAKGTRINTLQVARWYGEGKFGDAVMRSCSTSSPVSTGMVTAFR